MPEATFLRAIVTQAWQIAVLTVIVALLVRFFAARKPQVAHWLWLIVVVKCVTPPLWGHSFGLFSQIQSVVADGDVQTIRAIAPAAEADTMADLTTGSFADEWDVPPGDSEEAAFSFEPQLLPNEFETTAVNGGAGLLNVWAFTTWLLFVGMITSMLWLSWKFACCLRRIYAHRVTEFDDEIESVVATLAKELRLRRVPRVIISDVRFGPAVLGIFRHLIVLPKCLIADECCREPKTLRPILAHELLHIRRGDLWTGTLQAVVQCLWWFHPAVWIVNRLLSRETERSCDEQVVAELGCSPMDYARSLLAVIECKHSLKPVPVFPGMKPVEITSQRMERIMSLKQGSRTRKPWWSLIAVLLFAAVVLPGAVVGQQAMNLDSATPKKTDRTAVGYAGLSETLLSSQQVEMAKYEVNDLLIQLAKLHSLPLPKAKSLLVSDLIRVAESGNSPSNQQVNRPDSADQSPKSIADGLAVPEWQQDTLIIELTTAGHKRMQQRLAQFRKYGFEMVHITATVISGPRNIMDRLLTNCRAISASPPHSAAEIADNAVSLTTEVSRPTQRSGYFVTSVKHSKAAQQKLIDLNALMELKHQTQSERGVSVTQLANGVIWNGQQCRIEDCVERPFAVGFEKGQPQIARMSDGIKIELRAKKRDNKILLKCECEISTIDFDQSITKTQEIQGKLETVTIPSMRTRRFNRYLKMNPDHALVVGGLRQENGKDPERALIVVLQAKPTFAINHPGRQNSSENTLAPGKVPLRVRTSEQSGAERLWEIAGQMLEVGLKSNIGFDQKLGSVEESNSHATDQYFPYNAKVVAERAFVRSGSGEPFYATSALGRGSVVRVLREDPNGWLMIQPPEGSFSWVSKQDVRPTTKGKGEILNSNTVIFVGSSLKHELDVWQIRMDAGETVAIFDEQQMSTKTGLTQLFKIQPPTGEYRWIKSSALTPTDEAIRIVEPHPGPRFNTQVYPVDDIVSFFTRPATRNRSEPRGNKDSGSGPNLTDKDFGSLIELITTTVEPDSWDMNGGSGRLQANINTRSLVIRQRPYIHDKIVELLGQVRRLKERPIVTRCELLIFTTAQQIEWLEGHIKFGQHSAPHPWVLVPNSEKKKS